jgi:hypothetical protein
MHKFTADYLSYTISVLTSKHQPESLVSEHLGITHPVAILEGAFDLYFSESVRRRLTDGSVEKGRKLGSLTLTNPLRWRRE